MLGGKRFVAKEVSYSLDVDESNGEIQLTPIGDFLSREPYYLIDEYEGTYDTYGGEFRGTKCKVSSYNSLTQLVRVRLPKVKGTPFIAHGLELKLRKIKSK